MSTRGQAVSRNTAWGNVVVMPAVSVSEAAPSWYPAFEFSTKSLSIQLGHDLVRRLEQDVIESFKSITKRGSEVGGILMGRIELEPRTVMVGDYELFECAYARGPLYLLTDQEKRRFELAIRRRKTPDKLEVVGYFRSNTRKDLALDEEDRALFQAYFPGADSVALLIKPFSMKPSTASLYAWDDGRIEPVPGASQFTFRRLESQTGTAPAPPPPSPAIAPRVTPPPPPPPVEVAEVAPPEPAPAISEPEAPSVIVEEETLAPVDEAPEPELPAPPPAVEEIAPEPPPPPVVKVAEAAPVAPPPVVVEEEPATLELELNEPVEELPPAPEVETESAPPVEVAEEVEEPEATAEDVSDVPEQRPRPRALRWLGMTFGVMLVFAAGGVTGGYLEYRLGFQILDAQAASPQRSWLSLNVERSGGQLHLTWDRRASAVAASQSSTLFITDGSQNLIVRLSPSELRNGTFVYSPGTNDVVFRLEVVDAANGRTMSESIRSVASRPSPLVPAFVPSVVPSVPPPAEVPKETPPPAAAAQEPASTAPAQPGVAVQPLPDQPVQPPQAPAVANPPAPQAKSISPAQASATPQSTVTPPPVATPQNKPPSPAPAVATPPARIPVPAPAGAAN